MSDHTGFSPGKQNRLSRTPDIFEASAEQARSSDSHTISSGTKNVLRKLRNTTPSRQQLILMTASSVDIRELKTRTSETARRKRLAVLCVYLLPKRDLCCFREATGSPQSLPRESNNEKFRTFNTLKISFFLYQQFSLIRT